MASYGSLQDWWYLALLSPKEEMLWSVTAVLCSNMEAVDHSKIPNAPGPGSLPTLQASKFIPPYSGPTSTPDMATDVSAPVLRVALRGDRVAPKVYRVHHFLIEGYQ
jgi:hypothetical protein